jgi:hypothetical protein
MKSKVLAVLTALTVVAVLGLASAALAADVTLSGTVACPKCTLQKAGVTECGDVLVVAGEKGKTSEYWLVKNPVLEKFGHQCKGEKAVKVTGTVSEKDGKKWLAPTKIEAAS